MLHGLEKTAQSVNIMHSSQQALYFQAGSSWITKAPNLITNILILSHTQKKAHLPEHSYKEWRQSVQ